MRRSLWICLIVAALSGCGTNEKTYSSAQVQRSFARAGLPLSVGRDADASSAWSGTILVGHVGGELDVVVFDNVHAARAAFKIERTQATAASFDRRLANVLVISDGLSFPQRQRILGALVDLRR